MSLRRIRPWAIPGLSAVVLCGCATLDRGVRDDVAVVTDPPGARVVASTGAGTTICTSPCAVSALRRESVVVTVAKPGFVTATATSFSKTDDAATAAASRLEVTPDLLGRVIDVQDGSHATHEPKVLVVKLEKAP